MSKPPIDLDGLTRDEQLELLDRLWEALGRDPKASPLTGAQRNDLDSQLDELEREGPQGLSWDETVQRIGSRSR